MAFIGFGILLVLVGIFVEVLRVVQRLDTIMNRLNEWHRIGISRMGR